MPRLLTCLLLSCALLAGASADAVAAKRCGSFRAPSSGPWGKVTVTVEVQKGKVTCKEARGHARKLFGGKGRYRDGGSGHNSWWILPGGWTGDGSTGGWVLQNKKRGARIGGQY